MKRLCMCCATAVLLSHFAVIAQDNYQSWSFYRSIALNTKASGAKVGTSGSPAVVHFPLLVRLSGHIANGGNANDSIVMAQSAFSATNGRDIRFSKWDGAHFRYQRERWDAANMYAEFWVLVDTVWGGDSVNAANYPGGYLKMYWGNGNAGDSTNGAAVFDTANGYQAVYHLSEATNTPVLDATINAFAGTPGGTTLPHSVTGMIGPAMEYDSNGYYVMNGTASGKLDFPAGGSYTLSAWINPSRIGGGDYIISKINSASATGDYAMCYRATAPAYNLSFAEVSAGNVKNYSEDASSGQAGNWQHVVGVRNGATQALYVNGVFISNVTSTGGTTRSDADNLQIGSSGNGVYQAFNGVIDEAQLANVARDSNWIRLSYENQRQINASGATALGTGLDSLTIRGPVAGLGIISQPKSQWVVAGANATFTIVAGGMSPITYRWINGADTVGTASTLTLSAVQASANNSVYRCLVTNPLAFVMSNPCTLHVVTAPVITSQPISQTVMLGSNASFSVTAIGIAPLSYKWVLSPYNVASDTVGNAATLALSSVQAAADNSIYKCVAANSAGSAVSNPCTLHVLIAPPAPTIVSPAPNAVIKVDSVVFRWNKGGYATTSYMVEVAIDSAMTTILYQNSSLTDTTMTIQFSYALQAYWLRISAHNSVGWGPFSASQKFTISPSSVAPGGYGAASFALSVNGKDLRYSLPRPGSVCVKLYDVSGREVATLVKGMQGAGSYRAPLGNITAGSYIMTFDAAGLALRKTIVVP